MSEWKEYTLGDLIDVKHGYAFNGNNITEEPTHNILVTPGNFQIGGGFKSSKYKYYNADPPDEYLLKEGDVIVTMTDLSQTTDTLGYSAKIPKNKGVNYLHNQRIGLVNFISKEVEKEFIYWLMRTREYQGFIVGSASGTSIMHTAPSRIKEYAFLLPTLKEQIAIASILNSLDDKIDLLLRQNKTLEQLAETLFRQWFIEDVESNELTTVGEFALNIRENAKVEDLKKYEHYVGLEHIPKKSISLTEWDSPNELESNKSVFEENDILFGKLRSYFHKVVFAPIRGVCSTDILVVRPKKKEWFSFCLFWFCNKGLVEYSDLGSGGTRMPRTNWEILSSFQIPKPNQDRIQDFEKIAGINIKKIKSNIIQIHTLMQLRDNLLPKLMSGEVQVEKL